MTSHQFGSDGECQVSQKTVLLATGNLTWFESVGLRLHLIRCSECRKKLNVHRTIHGALLELDGPTVAPPSLALTGTRVKMAVASLAIAAIVAAGWLYTSWLLAEGASRSPASSFGSKSELENKDRSKARGNKESSLERCEDELPEQN